MRPHPTSRDVPIVPVEAALIIIDIQNYCSRPDGGEWKHLDSTTLEREHAYYFDRLRTTTLPNIKRLQEACRAARGEVIFTVIESLTLDGRDRGLDYKISGFNVPKGSWEAQVLAEVAPRRRRDRHPQDIVQRLHLDQYRLRPACARRPPGDLVRWADRSVRRIGGPRRLRPELSRHPRPRRLRDPQPTAPRLELAGDPRLLPAGRCGASDRGDRRRAVGQGARPCGGVNAGAFSARVNLPRLFLAPVRLRPDRGEGSRPGRNSSSGARRSSPRGR